MSYDGKDYIHLKEYSIMQLLYAATSPAYIQVVYLNNPSDGKGIRGIPSAVEMGNKKKKTFTKIVAVARFLIFQMPI